MKGIFLAIKEVASLVFSCVDPGKRREAYKLHLDKRRGLALDAAEKYILINKDIIALKNKDNLVKGEVLKLRKLKKRLKIYEKRFFKWN